MALCLQHRCPLPAAGAGLDYGLCERHGTVERNRRLAERDVQERAREEATLRRAAAPQRPTTTLPPSPPRFVVGEPKRLAPPPIHHKPPVPKARRVDSGSAGLPVRPPPVDAESTPTPDAAPEAEEIPMPNDIARPAHIGFACEAHPVTTLSETLQATMLALAHYFKGPGVDHEGNWRNTLAEDLNISPHAAYQRLTRLEAELCITDTGTEVGIKRLEQIHITAVGWATVEYLRDEQEEASAPASVAQTEDTTDDDTALEEPLELERTAFGPEDDSDALARLVYSASLGDDEGVPWEETHPNIRSACRRSAKAVREAVLAQGCGPTDTVPRESLAHLALDLGLVPGASVQEIRDAVADVIRQRDNAQIKAAKWSPHAGLMASDLGLPSGAQPYEVGNAVSDLAKAHRAVTAERDSLKAALDGAMERSITSQQALRVTEARLREALDEVDRLQEVSRYALTAGQVDSLRRGARFLEDSDDIGVSYVDGLLTMLLATLPEPATDAVKAAK